MPEIKRRVKEEGLENTVLFLESRTDVPRLFQAIDVFVFPSLFEGFPTVLV